MVRYKMFHMPSHPKATPKGDIPEHVMVAERALGRYLPPGSQVHHVDGNTRNNAPSNLVICQDDAYHKLLHVRARILRAGGDPNTSKICSRCWRVKPLSEFHRHRSNKSTGRRRWCRSGRKRPFSIRT